MDKPQTLINGQAYSIQISDSCDAVTIVLTNIVTKTSYCCSLDDANIRNITLTGGFIRSLRQFTGLLNLGAKNQDENGKIKLSGKIDTDDNTLLLSLTVKLDVEDISDYILYVIPMQMVEKKDIDRMEEMMLDFCNNYTSNVDEKEIALIKETVLQLTEATNKDKKELQSLIVNIQKQSIDALSGTKTELTQISTNDKKELQSLIVNIQKQSIDALSGTKTELTQISTNDKKELQSLIVNIQKQSIDALSGTKTELTQISTNDKNELKAAIADTKKESTQAVSGAKTELTQLINNLKTELTQMIANTKAELAQMINDNKAAPAAGSS
jgi:hypothetical protein